LSHLVCAFYSSPNCVYLAIKKFPRNPPEIKPRDPKLDAEIISSNVTLSSENKFKKGDFSFDLWEQAHQIWANLVENQ